MSIKATLAAAAILGLGATGIAFAQSGAPSGPVATSCSADIARQCAGRPHDGSTRICLEQKYSRLSASCKKALDSTGGGRGKGLGRGQGKGKGKAA